MSDSAAYKSPQTRVGGSLTASASDDQLGEFVFQVLCARARRRFSSLDRATLRGLLQRCKLRIQALSALGRQPVALVNHDEGDLVERQRISALFTRAVVSRALSVEDRVKRDAFQRRMASIVVLLRRHTPYTFLESEVSAEDLSLLRRLLIDAGLRPDAATLTRQIAEALPAWTPPAAPLLESLVMPAEPAFPPPTLRGPRLLMSPSPVDSAPVAMAVLERSLPQWSKLNPPPRVELSLPVEPTFSSPDAHRHFLMVGREADEVLDAEGLDMRGRPMQRTYEMLGGALFIGCSAVAGAIALFALVQQYGPFWIFFPPSLLVILGLLGDVTVGYLGEAHRVERRRALLRDG